MRASGVASHRQAAKMRLIDHRIGPGDVRRPVVAPIEAVVGDHRFEHPGRAVAPIERKIGASRMEAVAEQRVRPFELAGERFRIRVEQQLVRIEAMAGAGVVRAIGAIAVDLSDLGVGKIAVPDFVGALRQRRSADFAAPGTDRTGKDRSARRAPRTPRNSCRARPRTRRGGKPSRRSGEGSWTPWGRKSPGATTKRAPRCAGWRLGSDQRRGLSDAVLRPTAAPRRRRSCLRPRSSG